MCCPPEQHVQKLKVAWRATWTYVVLPTPQAHSMPTLRAYLRIVQDESSLYVYSKPSKDSAARTLPVAVGL